MVKVAEDIKSPRFVVYQNSTIFVKIDIFYPLFTIFFYFLRYILKSFILFLWLLLNSTDLLLLIHIFVMVCFGSLLKFYFCLLLNEKLLWLFLCVRYFNFLFLFSVILKHQMYNNIQKNRRLFYKVPKNF